jgi:hypothetical protein
MSPAAVAVSVARPFYSFPKAHTYSNLIISKWHTSLTSNISRKSWTIPIQSFLYLNLKEAWKYGTLQTGPKTRIWNLFKLEDHKYFYCFVTTAVQLMNIWLADTKKLCRRSNSLNAEQNMPKTRSPGHASQRPNHEPQHEYKRWTSACMPISDLQTHLAELASSPRHLHLCLTLRTVADAI